MANKYLFSWIIFLWKNNKEISGKYKGGGGRNEGEESVYPSLNKTVWGLGDKSVENSGESINKSQSIWESKIQ